MSVYTRIKDNLSAALITVAAVVAGWLAWGSYKRRVGKLKDAIAVEKAGRKVAKLEAQAEAAEHKELDLEVRDKHLSVEIAAIKRDTLAKQQEVGDLTDAEVAEKFNLLLK